MMIYTEPFMVILEYLQTLNKKKICFEYGVPFIVTIGGFVYMFFHQINSYILVKYAQTLLVTLLGFTLAAMAIFLAGGEKVKLIQKYSTQIAINGQQVNLYRLMILGFSYQVIVEAILCVLFLVGAFFHGEYPYLLSLIINLVYIMFVLHICFSTIRSITDLYWILIKEYH